MEKQNIKLSKIEILNDYKIAYLSRQVSLMGRREVLTGKAKFGVFGDGKELAQVAAARHFQLGDWRSGYYRDQTFMFATGMSNPDEFFAQLYGDTTIKNNPSNAGRSFNNHWGNRYIDENGNWKNQTKLKNTAADLSPTAGQMPRLIGLAYASKLYRQNPELQHQKNFSVNGNEVAFGFIGDASTSEGHFFETINAAGVLQIPLAISVWDDGYGISVSKKYQTTKESISELLAGMEPSETMNGVKILKAHGWNYPELVAVYEKGIKDCRTNHQPILIHIEELTQPQGHSTSGSHERYKSKERLDWEKQCDCMPQMRKWLLESGNATSEELEIIEKEAETIAKNARNKAWKNYTEPIIEEKKEIASDNRPKIMHMQKRRY